MTHVNKESSFLLDIKSSLELICVKTGTVDTDELERALDFLDSVKDDPRLPTHLAHQLQRRSYGKALQQVISLLRQ